MNWFLGACAVVAVVTAYRKGRADERTLLLGGDRQRWYKGSR